MESFTRTARAEGSSVRTVWRYILFNHNDKADQLGKAFEMASAFGVHDLRFIFTHKGIWSTALTSAAELRDLLIDLKVPPRSIQMDSFNSLRKRQKLSQLLKRNHTFYRTARKLWRKVKRNSSRSTIITADYYQLYEPELKKRLIWDMNCSGREGARCAGYAHAC